MASKSIGTLTVDLIAKVGGFVAGMDKAERESAKFRRQVQKNLSDVGKTLLGLGVASAVATAALVKSSISNAAALYDQSQAYGVAVEDLSAYAHGAEMADVSSEQLAVGLRTLNQAIESDADALKKLGISSRDGNGNLRATSDVLEDIAERFAGMADGAAKGALAQDLLGRSGANMIPWLNEGREGLAAVRAEAEQFNLVVDKETAAAADAFEDNLVKMKAVVRGTGLELAQSLLPELVELTDTINDPATQEGLRLLVKGMADFVIETVKLVALIPSVTKFFGESLAANIGGAAFGDLPRLEDQLVDINRQIDRLEEPRRGRLNVNEESRLARLKEERDTTLQLIQLSEEFAASANASAPAGAAPSGGSAPTGLGRVLSDDELSEQEKLNQLVNDRLAKYREQVLLHGKTTELSRLQAEIESGLLKVSEEQRADLELWAQAVGSLEWSDKVDAARESGEQIEADLLRQIALFGETSEAARLRYELEQEALALMDPLMQTRLVALAEELDAQRALAEEEKAAAEERDKQGKALQELGLEAARNIQGHFADFLFDPFDDGLKGMVKGMGNTVRRMAAEIASSAILKSLFGALSKSGNPYMAAIGGAFAGKLDTGGTIGAGQWGIAGEIGPELIRGPAVVTSRAQTASMLGGGVSVNIINNAGANVRQGQTRFDGGRRTIDIIIDAVREGGRNGQLDDLFGDFGMSRSRST